MLNVIVAFFMQFVNPLGFVGLILFITLFLVRKKPKTTIWFLVICLLIVGVLGNPNFSVFLTRSMEWRYMPSPGLDKADAILLIADGTYPAATPRQRVEVGEGADRVLYAAQLYQQELAPMIILSGNQSGAASSRTLLMELGVPGQAILLDSAGPNMRVSVKNMESIAQNEGYEDLILVTSALQMDRTLFLLEESDFNITPAPVDYQVTLQDWQAREDWNWQNIITNLMPNSEALQQSFAALWEYIGLAFYRVRAIF